MIVGPGRSANCAARFSLVRSVLIAAGALTLAACSHYNPSTLAATQPRGATVAFDSIDGPPPAQFETLVRNLNDEAQMRRLAVMSREDAAAYRVRGYLAAKIVKDQKGQGHTTISWIWDVFDRDQNRAFRIEGEQQTKGTHGTWATADEATMSQIARASMERLAAFLTSPEVAPESEPAVIQAAYTPDNNSPEAAGIFRIFHAHADPLPADPARSAAPPDDSAGQVPLPPQRPGSSAAVAPADKVTLAASAF